MGLESWIKMPIYIVQEIDTNEIYMTTDRYDDVVILATCETLREAEIALAREIQQ